MIPPPASQIRAVIRRLYAVIAELNALYPGRHFTPDGHLVGSLGEVVAAERYGLKLHPASREGHDAIASDGRQVEVKATQRARVALRSSCQHLLVLQMTETGEFNEVYNGPGSLVWECVGARQKNGQHSISLSKLRRLMREVGEVDRLPRTPEA